VAIIQQPGRDTQLVKLDLKDAYRIVPVHPADFPLLGIQWRERVYIDRALPFGLRSAPKLFNAVADTIVWVLSQHGITHLPHYLDDFLFLAAPLSHEGEQILRIALETLKALGIPVATHKNRWPAGPLTILTFLGILIDTHAFELRLPADKLTWLQQMIRHWITRRS